MIFNIRGRKKNQGSDEEILDEFRSTGNLDLLGELYSRYMHLVYGVCLKYLRERDESMDAVMQIFEKLITEIPRHKIENFRSWLHVVTKNYCLMQLRSEKTRTERMTVWMNDPTFFMENDEVLHRIDEDEAKMDKKLTDCIEKLNSEQKESISLFYFGDKCYNEIAATMNIDEKKVKSYLQNAKRNLKLCLEKKHGREE
jgi:RNA polymerase sigma-70 factor (ECF subfamily)